MHILLSALNVSSFFVKEERVILDFYRTVPNWKFIIPFIILLATFVVTIVVFWVHVFYLGDTYRVTAGGVSIHIRQGTPITQLELNKLAWKIQKKSNSRCYEWYTDPTLTKRFAPGLVYHQDIALFPVVRQTSVSRSNPSHYWQTGKPYI